MDAVVSPAPDSFTVAELDALRGKVLPPIVIDVRGGEAYAKDETVIAGALRRAPESVERWAAALERGREVVVYCVHGHQVSQGAASRLKALGHSARFLVGGIEAWRAAAGAVRAKPPAQASRWVTRERPKIDRIACPWLIRRFIDPDAQFFYVPTGQVFDFANNNGAVAYDIPGAEYAHEGEFCSFDYFIKKHAIRDTALDALALVVRGADTGNLALAQQASGLLAVSLGLSRLYTDDQEMLRHGLLVYDALYAWCREAKGEKHFWNPDLSVGIR
ncbi:MAG: chromate resistance protein [Betaproteobacteria bacterium]|nr:chromate resistance protein [Betaproteobacteria bacterium]